MPKSYWPDKYYERLGVTARPPEAGVVGSGSTFPRRRLRWGIGLGLVGMVLAGVVIGALVVELPYYAFRPGSVRDASTVITIDGVDVYPADGSLNFTTVQVRQVNTLELIMAGFDDDIEIRTREEYLGDRTPDETRQQNVQMMDTSQMDATYVALGAVGYEVDAPIVGELVHGVEEGLPAAGVLEAGDLIVELEGEALDSRGDLACVLSPMAPGDEVDLVVQPLADDGEPGEPEEHTLTLAPAAEDPERGILGVIVAPHELTYDFPVDVRFDTGDVGGPSAGLAFTLTLIDLLTEGDLTGGLDVAVTGTIQFDGTVGAVDGTAQKAAAARRDGMDLFLVPAAGDNYERAVPHAGDVEVVPVSDIGDALEVLAERGGLEVEPEPAC